MRSHSSKAETVTIEKAELHRQDRPEAAVND
jgi:hypothetical protein